MKNDTDNKVQMKDIETRQEAEKAFHDIRFSTQTGQNYYGLGFTSIINNKMIDTIGDLKGVKVLEMGCGTGWFTKVLAESGGEVWAFDISEEAVKQTKTVVEGLNLDYKVHIDQMGAERLQYESNKFDIVVGNAILHHLDLEASLKEVHRVLKKNGRAIFMEPMGHNPILNLYRILTPHLRSKDEVPILFEHFPIIEKPFSKFEHEEYYLTTLFALSFYFLGMNRMMIKIRNILYKLDQSIISAFPSLRKYCWYSIFSLEK